MDALDQKVEIFIYCVPRCYPSLSQNTNFENKILENEWEIEFGGGNWSTQIPSSRVTLFSPLAKTNKLLSIVVGYSRLFFAFAEEVKCPALDM